MIHWYCDDDCPDNLGEGELSPVEENEVYDPCDDCQDLCGIDKFNQCNERLRP